MTDAEKVAALQKTLTTLLGAASDVHYYRRQGTDSQFYARLDALEARADEAQTVLEETE